MLGEFTKEARNKSKQMGQLRRGFKTWCENAARGYRRELGLRPVAPLDPRLLAAHLRITVWRPADIPGLTAEQVHQLTATHRDAWSAATLRNGDKSLIIINDGHSEQRQNNSLAHEIGHVVLLHKPAKMMVSPEGFMMMTDYDPGHEEEATIFSGAILVPREALLTKISEGMSDNELANYFAVSPQLVTMRRHTTGINMQLNRRQRGTWVP